MKKLIEISKNLDYSNQIPFINNQQNHWDGLCLPHAWMLTHKNWMDQLDQAELPIDHLHQWLPDQIAKWLPDLPDHQRNDFLDHAASILSKVEVFDVQSTDLSLGFSRLGWPHRNAQEFNSKNLEQRLDLLAQLLPLNREWKIGLGLNVRFPIPSGASQSHELLETFFKPLQTEKIGLMATIQMEELKTTNPIKILGKLSPYIEGVRIQYQPESGVLPDLKFHRRWAEHLEELNFTGRLTWAPEVSHSEAFQLEVRRLQEDILPVFNKVR